MPYVFVVEMDTLLTLSFVVVFSGGCNSIGDTKGRIYADRGRDQGQPGQRWTGELQMYSRRCQICQRVSEELDRQN